VIGGVRGVWYLRLSGPGRTADVLVVTEDAPRAWRDAGDLVLCRESANGAAAILAASRALSSADGAGAAVAAFPGGCAWVIRGSGDFAGAWISEPGVELACFGAVSAAVLAVSGCQLDLPEDCQHFGRVVGRVEIAHDP
jgi:hypothetical protein